MWELLDDLSNLVIKEKPELTIYLLSMIFLSFQIFIMYLIVKKVLDSKN
jgi:hypothetical protein